MESKKRINREKKTVEAMVKLSCNSRHNTKKGELCSECSELLNYARTRLGKCTFGENKPVCANCTIHCYKPNMRESIKEVMRYAGPKMVFTHPILSIRHLIDQHFKTQ